MLETTNYPTRRRWLESAALLTVGTALAAKSASQFSWPVEKNRRANTRHQPTAVEKLVQETPEPLAPPTESAPLTYEEFLTCFHLRHIQPHEIINPHYGTTRGIANSLPPRELWRAMPATLFVADEIRERLGLPLKLITSAYRNPTYNRACGGASQSWHTKNCALDLVYEGGPRAAYAIAEDLRREGFFEGGIGLYQTFIHLDTRGHNATWRG